MIKPNWDVFRAKFAGELTTQFEWFCYLLFCKEHERPYGIFRFRNQAGIETEPITTNTGVIGWQAKFYDTLANNTADILDGLRKAHKYNSALTTYYFYSHKAWGTTKKGTAPKGLKDFRALAKELDIELVLRTTSYFESSFVCIEHSDISEYFFQLEGGVYEQAKIQMSRTQTILSKTKPFLSVGDEVYTIDRSEQLSTLMKTQSKVVIISGSAGVGKTALIKNLVESQKDQIPIFVFRATEFDLSSLEKFFLSCRMDDFLKSFEDDEKKIFVVDSAEKILDLRNPDPFQDFLSQAISNDWQLIFTTRDSYLEELIYQVTQVYKINAITVRVEPLAATQIEIICEKFDRPVPKDEKVLQLLKIPFYLNLYLRLENPNELSGYISFKDQIWNELIKKSKPERERVFIKIAVKRANSGGFFTHLESENDATLNELKTDEILGHSNPGYFITYDIHEEWALERHISNTFITKSDANDFFARLGTSLPIRRSFQKWIAERLLLEDNEIMLFIESALTKKTLETFWKDEILTAILLSNYSKNFFHNEVVDLVNDLPTLKRLTFLLQISCKMFDDRFITHLEATNLFLTIPKGFGWQTIIEFVFNHRVAIGIECLSFFVPILSEWTKNRSSGKTTKESGLLALEIYRAEMDQKYYSPSEALVQTILCSANEIKTELEDILNQVIDHRWCHHRDPYFQISQAILNPKRETFIQMIRPDNVSVLYQLPEAIFGIAELFWFRDPDNLERSGVLDVDVYFGLSNCNNENSSALRTPIYQLLTFHQKKSMDFILNFVNASIEKFVESGFDDKTENVRIFFENEEKVQHASSCLWNLYRGTSSPVSPNLLQSIHMALEKYLWDCASKEEGDINDLLLYIIRNSNSVSITAVCVSIILAFPNKTFRTAKVLFKTKMFFHLDTLRCSTDRGAKLLYSISFDDLYKDERLDTCEQMHRTLSLEAQFFKYLMFLDQTIDEKGQEQRQCILHDILDHHYKELPDSGEEIWRLCLAKMDNRKMKLSINKVDDGTIILSPELTPELKAFSENSIAVSGEPFKYSDLIVWSKSKFDKNSNNKIYEKYETNPSRVLIEVRDVISQLAQTENTTFKLMNESLPPYALSVLIRDYLPQLSESDSLFCKEKILDYAVHFYTQNYLQYQIGDGSIPIFSVLLNIIQAFPTEKENVKSILLFAVLREFFQYRPGTERFPMATLRNWWQTNPSDAESFLYAYLKLKPEYDKGGLYNVEEITNFCEKHQASIQKYLDNNLSPPRNFSSGQVLVGAFHLLPFRFVNDTQRKIAVELTKRFLDPNDSNKNSKDSNRDTFFKAYSIFILQVNPSEIAPLLAPFSETELSNLEDLFEALLRKVQFETSKNFWIIWKFFEKRIVNYYESNSGYSQLLQKYLLASPFPPRINFSSEGNLVASKLLNRIINKLGHHQVALPSIAILLNNFSNEFIDEGVPWLSLLVRQNSNVDDYTCQLLENFVKRFIFENRDKIRKKRELKKQMISVLNFLVEMGSVVGYMMRDRIL